MGTLTVTLDPIGNPVLSRYAKKYQFLTWNFSLEEKALNLTYMPKPTTYVSYCAQSFNSGKRNLIIAWNFCKKQSRPRVLWVHWTPTNSYFSIECSSLLNWRTLIYELVHNGTHNLNYRKTVMEVLEEKPRAWKAVATALYLFLFLFSLCK